VYTVFAPHSLFYTLFLWVPTPQKGHVLPSCSPICKRKKWHFCLFQIVIWGVSLWHYHVMHLTWIGLFPFFFPVYLRPFFAVISRDLKILYSFLYRNYINHIHLLSFLL
jgi:hypothetical protein